MSIKRRPIKDRFLEKVDIKSPNECWIWKGAIHHDGYGAIWVDSGDRAGRAHQVSYRLFIGAIPPGLCVCHRCDNPKCVNPNHLFLGTQQDNVIDSVLKGRSRNHEKNGMAKLTTDQVREIRLLHDQGMSEKKLAIKFGIGKTQAHRIVAFESWK